MDLIIIDQSNMGFEAIINHRHLGILYRNEVFQNLRRGQQIQGYIKKIRDDGKVDLQLQPPGIQGRADLAEKILAKVEAQGGFLPVTDKSDPKTDPGAVRGEQKKVQNGARRPLQSPKGGVRGGRNPPGSLTARASLIEPRFGRARFVVSFHL